jgi:hypothetical protein
MQSFGAGDPPGQKYPQGHGIAIHPESAEQ